MHKYLDDLGVTNCPDNYGSKNDKRQKVWKKQRKKYGFDNRELWNLDYTFYLWLYEHVMRFKKVASKVIDMSSKDSSVFTYKDKKYTQMQLIDMLIERLEYRLCGKYDDYELSSEAHYEFIQEIPYIWAVLLPAMWY